MTVYFSFKLNGLLETKDFKRKIQLLGKRINRLTCHSELKFDINIFLDVFESSDLVESDLIPFIDKKNNMVMYRVITNTNFNEVLDKIYRVLESNGLNNIDKKKLYEI